MFGPCWDQVSKIPGFSTYGMGTAHVTIFHVEGCTVLRGARVLTVLPPLSVEAPAAGTDNSRLVLFFVLSLHRCRVRKFAIEIERHRHLS